MTLEKCGKRVVATQVAADSVTLIVAWPHIAAFAARLLHALRRRKPAATLSISLRTKDHRVDLNVKTTDPSQFVAALRGLAAEAEGDQLQP